MAPRPLPAAAPARARIRVRGQVQGVGFRPFVYRVAVELGLTGWVRNDSEGVEVEAEGDGAGLAELARRLEREPPPLARVDSVESEPRPATGGEPAFEIRESSAGRAATGIAPDTAVCGACLGEMLDPADRRWRYAFINCTHCGPRYTITRRIPYDRPNTSMARFIQCPACQAEYDDPADRRFHAQPNACPVCGPRLELLDTAGAPAACDDPVAATVAALRAGRVVAIKGLGGFHLACDARNAAAVAELRRRKNRDEKPFAVMAANSASLRDFADIDAGTRALLETAERPIVLLPARAPVDGMLPGIAPGLDRLGAMLPCAPLHYLLFHEASGRPAGTGRLDEPVDLLLVMTSANPGGEPLVTASDEAVRRLAGIADLLLVNDRDIVVRVDDSVVTTADPSSPHSSPMTAHPKFLRRARGYTPRAIRLGREGPPVLATGGYFKSTVCVTRGAEAFLSQHIGSLDNAPTCGALEEAVAHLLATLEVEPVAVAHDLHPDFFSSRYAAEFAAQAGIPAIAVQHHHAHIAAVAAEHGIEEPLLGLALDGVGLGSDGEAWGGELLRVHGARSERLGHLRELPLPGGDRAARAPWRMAAAALHLMGRGEEIARRFPHVPAWPVAQMLANGLHTPPTSSAGRWFDAAAGLLRVKDQMAFEGQAAMLLEALAQAHGPAAPLGEGWRIEADGTLDLLPLLAALADEADAGRGAALFHATLARALADWTAATAEREGLRSVALGGGCFMNRILTAQLRDHLEAVGLAVHEARAAPPNDGGLSLGQAWVALHREEIMPCA